MYLRLWSKSRGIGAALAFALGFAAGGAVGAGTGMGMACWRAVSRSSRDYARTCFAMSAIIAINSARLIGVSTAAGHGCSTIDCVQ